MTLAPRGVLQGILWDMDGTSIDSAPLWNTGIRAAAAEMGVEWDESDDAVVRGHGMWSVAARFRQKKATLTDAVETVALIERHTVESAIIMSPVWLPGVRELLEACAGEGVRCALVTMSGRRSVEAILGDSGLDLFDVIVSGSDVAQPKPHPEPYLTGMDRLGLAADSCVALEDSLVGITAAVAAGVTTIAVNAPAAVQVTGPVVRWQSLSGRSLDDVRDVHAAASPGARTGGDAA
ncbi:HAD family hydrolase [Microbacterium sp. NPDC058342]|uniref:HAD family hydrolase n=1 Tax=Microbacterium sp. NPDC058342 TaxID=3346454 RepID=UPI00364DE16A